MSDAAMLRQTVAWIEAEPLVVTLHRQARERDPSGGYGIIVETTLDPQRMRLIVSANQLPVRRGADGQEITPQYMLNALPDADIAQFDYFMIGAVKYEVVFVHPDRFLMTRAEVWYRG